MAGPSSTSAGVANGTSQSGNDYLGADRSGSRSVTGGGRGLGESAAAAAVGGGSSSSQQQPAVGQALAVAQQQQQHQQSSNGSASSSNNTTTNSNNATEDMHMKHYAQQAQYSYGIPGYQASAAQMYQYMPSPGLHPVNLGMMGMTHPPSPGLFPGQFMQAAPSPYLGPASLSPFPATPLMQASSSAGTHFDFYPRPQQLDGSEPPAPSPGPSPFLHPLLPQSLLGTPPTTSMQFQQFYRQQQQAAEKHANNGKQNKNASGQNDANQRQNQQNQELPPPLMMPSLQLNQDMGENAYAPQTHNLRHMEDIQNAFQQHAHMQQAMPTMVQYSPAFGPSGYAMYAYAPQAQYYAAAGFSQPSPGMIPTEMMSPTLAMPSIAQLPPSAAQSPPAGQSSARYLSSTNSVGSAPSAAPSPKSTRGNEDRKGPAKLEVDTAAESRNAATGAAGNGNDNGTPCNLLEKLHNKVGVSPRNGSGGSGAGRHKDANVRGQQAQSNAGSARGPASGPKRDKKSTPPIADVEWGLRSIRGQVVEFAKDQHGSRFLQTQLDSPSVSAEDKENLVAEILPHARRLCADVFGNYTIQKLLTHGASTPAQQEQLVKVAIEGHMVDHSNGSYSCRVIQKMIECIFSEQGEEVARSLKPGDPGATLYSVEYQDKLLHELDGHVISCACSNNANHVLQKLLECVRPLSRIDFIFDAFKGNMVQLSTQSYACRVAQRAMENAEDDRLEPLLAEIMANVEVLIQDSFGNYVTQHIIQHGSPNGQDGCLSRHRAELIEIVKLNLLRFSQHKFSSNVVERCLESGNKAERRNLIAKMLEVDRSGSNAKSTRSGAGTAAGGSQSKTLLEVMMTDQFANYVIQKALEVAEPDQREQIVTIIQRNAGTLKRLTYGRHILNRLELNSKSGGSRRGRRNNTGTGSGGRGQGSSSNDGRSVQHDN